MASLLLALAVLTQPLTLDEAIRLGLAHQPELQAAEQQVELARSQARESRAGLLPQVGLAGRLGVTETWSDAPDRGLTTSSGATLTADQLLWDFGTTSDRWRAAQLSADAARLESDAVQQEAILAIRLAFFQLLEAQALVGVARHTLANQQRRLRQVEEFVTVGARPAIDLAKLRTQVATAQAGLVRAEGDERTARVALRAALGLPGTEEFAVVVPQLPPLATEQLPTADLVERASRSRQELAARRTDLRAQELRREALQARYWPTLRAQAQGGYAHQEPLGGSWAVSAGLNLSWSLFDGWATSAALEAAEAQLALVRTQLAGLELALWQQLEQARVGVLAAQASQAAAEQTAASAQELLRQAEERYAQGVGNALELADAQLEAATAAAGRVQAEYSLAAARARLLRALGERDWH